MTTEITSQIAYYKISKCDLIAGNYSKGHNIIISRVGAYDKNNKWIKWVPLAEFVNILNEAPIKHPLHAMREAADKIKLDL